MPSSERTAEQARAENIAVMGQEIGAIYTALWQEVALIHQKWGQFVELFGTSPERVELLNKAAPTLFRTFQDSLWEDLLLHLARLTDPPQSVRKSNLSLRRLQEAVIGSPVETAVETLTSKAVTATAFARDWRNRKLAHRDLDLALGLQIAPLAPASRIAVKEALSAVADVLNVVAGHYHDSTTMFHFNGANTDAASLLYILRDGLRYEEERRMRLKSGTSTPDDFRPEKI
ncbi:hypothetical protein ACS77_04820 [Pseudomonas syringae]|uniref:HEPN AbiU2-like domain-containing protein n=1 Tax=Pseudomonas syringae TaxID=317 RepID=A0A0L1ML42_PSESX|nr:hypothetical protein ACS77_04820 [Pseudomonas syringae]